MPSPDSFPPLPDETMRAPSYRGLWWQAGAAVVAMVAFGTCALVVRGALQQRDDVRAVLSQLRQPYDQEIAALGARASGQSRLIASLADPDVRVVDLRPPSGRGAPGAAGRAFWRPSTHGWTVFARGLPAAPAGRTYRLWFVLADGASGAGGAFRQGEEESPVLATTFDAGARRIDALLITLDDSTASRPGGGTTVLVGSVHAR